MEAWLGGLADLPVIWLGTIAALAAGLATGVGALPIFFTRNISRRVQNTLLGFGAGVMLAATSFSLLIPGIEHAEELSGSTVTAALIVCTGMFLGGGFVRLADAWIPHEHFFVGPEGSDSETLRRIWLFVIAITIHNYPEGLAVGVGFASDDVSQAMALAIGIGLQNMPEGLAVALALAGEGYTLRRSFTVALASGLVEPVGGLMGAGIVTIASSLLPWGMAFAAGAMLYVISGEIIPESHQGGYAKSATAGVMVGFVVMMFLDVTLG